VDDVFIFSDSLEEHAEHLKECIRRLTEVNLILNQDKCHFGQESVYLLGFAVSHKKVQIDRRKVANVYDWASPTCGKHIQRFLGFANYFREHIPMFSKLTHRMDKLRNEGSIIHLWTPEHERDFQSLKTLLTKAPVLSIPDMNEVFHVATDASAYSIGGVIYQIIDDEYKYIGFAARSMSRAETHYSCTKRELLGMVYMLRRYHQYLWGNPFILYTDHKALCYLQTQVIANSMMIGWMDIICYYTYTVVHRPGVANVIPDALSRLFGEDDNDRVAVHQRKTISAPLTGGDGSSLVGGNKVVKRQEDMFSREIEMSNKPKAYLESVNAVQVREREKIAYEDYITPPEEDRQELLLKAHLFGHFGATAMVAALHDDGFHWQHMTDQAVETVKQCTECQLFNQSKTTYRPLKSILSDAPGDHWAVDLGTLNVTSPDGSNFILVMVDIFSRFCIARAIKDKSAATVAKELFKVFCDFGFPKVIQSDNGTEFVNEVVQHLIKASKIDHRLVLPYNPRANGAAEAFVKIIKDTVYKRLEGAKEEWADYLPSCQLAVNCKFSKLHGSRPYSIMFARQPNGFQDYSKVVSASHDRKSGNTNRLVKRIDVMSKKKVIPVIQER
jgi:transposase InsO family protein